MAKARIASKLTIGEGSDGQHEGDEGGDQGDTDGGQQPLGAGGLVACVGVEACCGPGGGLRRPGLRRAAAAD